MTAPTPQDLVEHALATTAADDCIAIAHNSTSANLRWANNTLTTNGAMRGLELAVVSFVRRAGGPAAGTRSGSATTPDQVAAVSHGCPTALFRDVNILNTNDEAGR